MTKKRKRRRPDQVVKLLQEGQVMRAVGKSEAEVFQRLENTESTWQRWHTWQRWDKWQRMDKQFGGMKSGEVKRLREVESENRRLKEMLVEAQLDKRILKTALERNY